MWYVFAMPTVEAEAIVAEVAVVVIMATVVVVAVVGCSGGGYTIAVADSTNKSAVRPRNSL